jgi:hypothetical protein
LPQTGCQTFIVISTVLFLPPPFIIGFEGE